MLIRDLMQRDLNERIEEVIQFSQRNQAVVAQEIHEYVVTARIRDHFRELLTAIAESPSDTTTHFEAWISGFFGSGKSSFAKILGYVLANLPLGNVRAAELFKERVNDPIISDLVDSINRRLPFEVIMFDVQTDLDVRDPDESLASIMYRALLRHLGYCDDDQTIAELEIALEGDGKLDTFKQLCQETFNQPWQRARKSAERLNRASKLLTIMTPELYPAVDSWARTVVKAETRISVQTLVTRSFDLMARQHPGKALAFVMDEVGQFVARNSAKIENLRIITQEFGQASVNRVQQRQVIAPTWLIVTSQEKLDQVVAALDARLVEVARVQDRFRHKVDLALADIREVATKRVLGKRQAAIPALHTIYQQHQGQLNTACHLEQSRRTDHIDEQRFIEFYPYLPHYIDLSIDIISGLRVQRDTMLHLSGSNRTVIKQAYQMLVSPATRLAEQPLGTLVTIDKIFDLVEGSLASEKQMDISNIIDRFKDVPGNWPARVAKAICLLDRVPDLPRSARNIAALLVDQIGQLAPVEAVQSALHDLEQAQYVRQSEQGYALMTALERSWDDERRALGDASERDFNDIRNAALLRLFQSADLSVAAYLGRTFTIQVMVEENRINEGQVDLRLWPALTAGQLAQRQETARNTSRAQQGTNTVYWVFTLSVAAQTAIQQIYVSREMIRKYSQASAQGRMPDDKKSLVALEEERRNRFEQHLREAMMQSLAGGQGIFRGVPYEAVRLGPTVPQIFHALFERVLPEIYPKLALGVQRVNSREAETFLKAARLDTLAQLYYEGGPGALVVRTTDNTFVPNAHAPIAEEIVQYLQRRTGEQVFGKMLIEHFVDGPVYGWNLEMLQLALAVLLRAGAIEITSQTHRYHDAHDPQARQPFTSVPAFRSATFTPRKPLDNKTLVAAARAFEAIAGEGVDVSASAIAQRIKDLANAEDGLLGPLLTLATVRAYGITDRLAQYRELLMGLRQAPADEAVMMLVETGATFKTLRDRATRARTVLTEANQGRIERARRILRQQWPALQALGADDT